jgi:hypothetical protein
MAGQGQPQMTQEELIEALLDACGRSKDQARAEELLGWGADPNALPYRYRTVTSMHYTRQFYGAMSRVIEAVTHAQVGPFGDQQQPDLGLVTVCCEKQGLP